MTEDSYSKRKTIRINSRVIAWYSVSGSTQKIMSQIVDISSGGLCLHANAKLEKGTDIDVEIKFPIFYPKLTFVKTKVVGCQMTQAKFYELRLKFEDMNVNTENEITTFIDVYLKKHPEVQAQQFLLKSESINSKKIELSDEQLYKLFDSLGSPAEIGQTRFKVSLKGEIILSEEDLVKIETINMGPTGIVFKSNERFLSGCPLKLKFVFPTNENSNTPAYLMQRLVPSYLNVIIMKTQSSSIDDSILYYCDYQKMISNDLLNLNKWLFHLTLTELGEQKVHEIVGLKSACLNNEQPAPSPNAQESGSEHEQINIANNKRNTKRAGLHFDGLLFNEMTYEKHEIQSIDISLGGAKIEMNHFIAPNDSVFLNFFIHIKDENTTMRIPGIVRWIKSLKEELYELGIQFDKDHIENSPKLKKLLTDSTS